MLKYGFHGTNPAMDQTKMYRVKSGNFGYQINLDSDLVLFIF